jgi:putative SOS response-associated peptidase YedK
MCGRYNLIISATELVRFFQVAEGLDFTPRYNIAPTQTAPIIRAGMGETGREILAARWGLLPRWSKEPATRFPLINARSETAAEKVSFKGPFRKRRCLVPANGFYEWKKTGKEKVPHLFRRKDQAPLAFAGLWEIWGQGADAITSYTILTAEAGEMMQGIHDRMPIILPEEAFDAWLNPDLKDTTEVQSLLVPSDPADFEAFPVGTYVSNARNDGPQCIEPA